jgi:hypothetical protein
MKLIQCIMGCALAAGLMTVAASQVQAASGIVVDNALYIPLKFSITASAEVGGKIHKVQVTEAQIISALNLPAKTTLVWDFASGDVWAMDTTTKTLNEDLTADGFLTLSNGDTITTTKGNTHTYTGTVSVEVYSNPVFVADVLDPEASASNSSSWIELSGDVKGSLTEGAIKNGFERLSVSYTAKGITGNVHFEGETVSATGSVSGSGSGSLQVP